jgi:hypothetical protein
MVIPRIIHRRNNHGDLEIIDGSSIENEMLLNDMTKLAKPVAIGGAVFLGLYLLGQLFNKK